MIHEPAFIALPLLGCTSSPFFGRLNTRPPNNGRKNPVVQETGYNPLRWSQDPQRLSLLLVFPTPFVHSLHFLSKVFPAHIFPTKTQVSAVFSIPPPSIATPPNGAFCHGYNGYSVYTTKPHGFLSGRASPSHIAVAALPAYLARPATLAVSPCSARVKRTSMHRPFAVPHRTTPR
ncbi:hypothetical protein FB451DRAFT_1290436 [Mycena latifolia]|nr:hypothetical protein FB451DRAFT_1290436 [Mycena latifolia]